MRANRLASRLPGAETSPRAASEPHIRRTASWMEPRASCRSTKTSSTSSLRKRAGHAALAALNCFHLSGGLHQAGLVLIIGLGGGDAADYHRGHRKRHGGRDEDIRDHAYEVAAWGERQDGEDAARREGETRPTWKIVAVKRPLAPPAMAARTNSGFIKT